MNARYRVRRSTTPEAVGLSVKLPTKFILEKCPERLHKNDDGVQEVRLYEPLTKSTAVWTVKDEIVQHWDVAFEASMQVHDRGSAAGAELEIRRRAGMIHKLTPGEFKDAPVQLRDRSVRVAGGRVMGRWTQGAVLLAVATLGCELEVCVEPGMVLPEPPPGVLWVDCPGDFEGPPQDGVCGCWDYCPERNGLVNQPAQTHAEWISRPAPTAAGQQWVPPGYDPNWPLTRAVYQVGVHGSGCDGELCEDNQVAVNQSYYGWHQGQRTSWHDFNCRIKLRNGTDIATLGQRWMQAEQICAARSGWIIGPPQGDGVRWLDFLGLAFEYVLAQDLLYQCAADACRELNDFDDADLDDDGETDSCDCTPFGLPGPDYCDADEDGFPDSQDNCPDTPNGQEDLDADGTGDACDEDRDGDFLDNDEDSCPDHFNPAQRDADGDGIGNDCQPRLIFPTGDPTLDPGPGGAVADENELTYTGGQNPTLTLDVEAGLIQDCNRYRWSVDSIGAIPAIWSPALAGSNGQVGTGCSATAVFHGMPENANAFGPKTVTLRLDDGGQFPNDTTQVEVFWPLFDGPAPPLDQFDPARLASNHPGAPVVGYEMPGDTLECDDAPSMVKTANFYHYWRQVQVPGWVHDSTLVYGLQGEAAPPRRVSVLGQAIGVSEFPCLINGAPPRFPQSGVMMMGANLSWRQPGPEGASDKGINDFFHTLAHEQSHFQRQANFTEIGRLKPNAIDQPIALDHWSRVLSPRHDNWNHGWDHDGDGQIGKFGEWPPGRCDFDGDGQPTAHAILERDVTRACVDEAGQPILGGRAVDGWDLNQDGDLDDLIYEDEDWDNDKDDVPNAIDRLDLRSYAFLVGADASVIVQGAFVLPADFCDGVVMRLPGNCLTAGMPWSCREDELVSDCAAELTANTFFQDLWAEDWGAPGMQHQTILNPHN